MVDHPRDDKKTEPSLGKRRHRATPAPTVPSSGHPIGEGQRGSVTIDFSGPPLGLPHGSSVPPSTLRPQGATSRGATGGPARSRYPSVQKLGSDTDEDHDAWVVDSQKRSTVPPPWDTATTGWATSATAVPALQHTWVSAQQVQPGAKPSSPVSIELPDADGDALALVERPRPAEPALDLMAEVRARFALDDLTGALHIAELVLGAEEHHEEANQIARVCRQRLELLYTSQMGSLAATPRVEVADADIRWLGLDHRAGFLLSHVDGRTSLEELLDLSGMPRLEALKTVLGLVDTGAIVIPR